MKVSELIRAAGRRTAKINRKVKAVILKIPTEAARHKWSLFPHMAIMQFDQPVAMYRIVDEKELFHINRSGKITGGKFSLPVERHYGASWGSDISEVIRWGNGQRGKRLGNRLFLIKLDAFDYKFMHPEPAIEPQFDPKGPAEQPVTFNVGSCHTGVGCSIMNVPASDCDFFEVDKRGQMTRVDPKKVDAYTPGENEPVDVTGLPLKPKDKIQVTKGSNKLKVKPHSTGWVKRTYVLGDGRKDRRVFVTLQISYGPPKPITLYAPHRNMLSKDPIRLRDSRGNFILIRKR